LTLHASQDGPVELNTGKAWSNGRGIIDRYMVSDEFNPVEFKINVTLQKGWNRILIKLTRKEERPWGFCVRLLGEDGKPLQGIRVDPAQPRD
jgi:hypothetical protein